MKTLQVALDDRSYPIYIGHGLLHKADLLSPFIAGRQVMVVSNETIAPLYLARVLETLAAYQCATVILPDGEEHKHLATVERIFDALLQARFARDATLVALGGGVVGDMTGFAAACYQRGVPFIQLPTTLLAQVDSSVGGKTGVNHPLGKNMIGAFHQPRCVLIDTATLRTLDERQLRAGLAEVIKYGLLRDADFFLWLEEHMESLLAGDDEILAYAIERSCVNKAAIVAVDERECGFRALLNLGHTFGHAIETGLGYGVWLHGEAIAAGMCIAAAMSARMGWIGEEDQRRIQALIARAGLPVQAPAALSVERFMALMAVDKKVQAGRLRLVLLQAIGKAVLVSEFSEQILRESITACQEASS